MDAGKIASGRSPSIETITTRRAGGAKVGVIVGVEVGLAINVAVAVAVSVGVSVGVEVRLGVDVRRRKDNPGRPET